MIIDQTAVDEGTLTKVIDSIAATLKSNPDPTPNDFVIALQNAGVLFRERVPKPPTFEFKVAEGDYLSLHAAVFQALGYASLCWSEIPTGEFDSERASLAGNALLDLIRRRVEKAIA